MFYSVSLGVGFCQTVGRDARKKKTDTSKPRSHVPGLGSINYSFLCIYFMFLESTRIEIKYMIACPVPVIIIHKWFVKVSGSAHERCIIDVKVFKSMRNSPATLFSFFKIPH